MDITVRKARVGDIPGIIEMNDIFNGPGCTAESVRGSLENPQTETVFVAVCGGRAIGMICGQLNPSVCYAGGLQCEVTELFVCEGYRRTGVAANLMERLEEEFIKNGGKEIIVKTGVRNVAARRFYEKNGYEDMKEIVYLKQV